MNGLTTSVQVPAYPPLPIYEALASLSTSHSHIVVSQTSEKLKCKQSNDVGRLANLHSKPGGWESLAYKSQDCLVFLNLLNVG